jgi:predicted LPLAT superfamily acyltransferase
MDDALARVGKESGRKLVWTEAEQHHLAAAARAADRVALLERQLDAEPAGENRATVMVKISAELRALDKAVCDHLGRVQVGDGTAKSEQHQRAVRARWDRRDAARAAARDGAS